MKNQARRGFTLVEMMLVLSIMGMLSSIIIASVSGARDRALDARRFTQMKQLQALLEIYNEENGFYPPTPVADIGGDNDGSYPFIISAGPAGFYYFNSCKRAEWIPDFVSGGYIPALPRESTNTADKRCFMYGSDGVDYRMVYYDLDGMDCSTDSSSLCDQGLQVGYGGFYNGAVMATEGARGWLYGD